MIITLLGYIVDFVFAVSLITLCYWLQRNINSSNDSLKEGFIGFLLICAGQCIGTLGILAIAISAALAGGNLPIPQSFLNGIGVVPLLQGIIMIFALLKEHGIFKGGSSSIFHTRWYAKIEESFNNIHKLLKKYIKDPIVIEITIYSFYSQANTTGSYVYVFSSLNFNTMLLFVAYMMLFQVVKTIAVWFVFHQIKLNLIYTLMIPTNIVPEKLTMYIYPCLLALTGFCLLSQSAFGFFIPK